MLLPDPQKKAYEAFAKSVRENDVLDPKTTVMVYMAAAMTAGCYP